MTESLTSLHLDNERMFDATSREYSTSQWFDRSARSPHAYDVTRRRLLELVRLTGTERIIEIGCGPGTWTKVLAERAASLTAVDISGEMIRRARAFVAPHPVTFVHRDVLALDVEGRFDRVVSLRAIEYVRDKQALARRLASLVDGGGDLVVVSKTKWSLWRGRRLFGQLGHRLRPGGPDAPSEGAGFYQERIAYARLRDHLRAAGMTDITVFPVITGLPVLGGVTGDLPLVPRRFTEAALSLSDRIGDRLASAPRWVRRASLIATESFAVRAHRPEQG